MDFFVSSLITSMRETLEALFVFITVFSIIKKSDQDKSIYWAPILGAILGIVIAVAAGVGVHYLGNSFDDKLWFKIIFDSLMLGSTLWFIIWMIVNSKSHSDEIKSKMINATSLMASSFFMVFISFFREGMETIAFTFSQASIWGILTGFVIAIITAILLFYVFHCFKIKYMMMVLMILLIMATSPTIGKFADDLIYKGDAIYEIPNDSTGMRVLNSFLRGIFGIKTSATALGLSLQLVWDVSLISLVVYKEVKNVSRS